MVVEAVVEAAYPPTGVAESNRSVGIFGWVRTLSVALFELLLLLTGEPVFVPCLPNGLKLVVEELLEELPTGE